MQELIDRKIAKIGDIATDREIGYSQHNYNKYMWAACVDCGKERWVSLRKGKLQREFCRSCTRRGKRNANWRGGKYKHPDGYIMIRKGNKYYLEHRLVMESYLGRKLKSEEIIHHINGIRDDNRIENLMVMSRSEHRGITLKLFKRLKELEKENKRLKEEIKCLKILH